MTAAAQISQSNVFPYEQDIIDTMYAGFVEERLKSGMKIQGFTPTPYRLHYFFKTETASGCYGIQPEGSPGERNFYRTRAEAEEAAEKFIRQHGYPEKIVLTLKRTLARFEPVWTLEKSFLKRAMPLEEEAKVLVIAFKPNKKRLY